ncbi:MAG: M15 family metallopeptidase [Alphaproteobacteria bacterium]
MVSTPSFSIKLLSQEYKEKLIKEGLWKSNCPVSLDRLREVHVTHYDFQGHLQKGCMVVLEAVAPFVMTIFQDLFQENFPVHKIVPIDVYKGDDDASMADNNSSAFNYRPIAGKTILSIHSYGLAIDINPVQNPYMGNSFINEQKQCGAIEVWPTAGLEYINRRHLRPGMVESIVDTFYKYGFRDWGGDWKDLMDYHHFQTPRFLADLLAHMTPDDADDFFEWYVENPQVVLDEKNILEDYKKDSNAFMKKYS